MAQGTIIHGVAASQNIDSSGEIVDIAGLDISSLEKDGVLNWAHKSDSPSQIVGKILKAKKIFSEKDCETDHELNFFNRCKAPYVYVIGELFDAQGHSGAKDVVAHFLYSLENKNKISNDVVGFSIEGSKISKDGMVVSRSIGRKVTIDPLPCNKMAVAQIVPSSEGGQSNDIDDLFKTESVEIEVLRPSEDLWHLLKKENPADHAAKLGIKPFKKDMGGGQSAGLASTGLSGVGPTSSGGIIGGESMMRSEMKKDMGPVSNPKAAPAPGATTAAATSGAHQRGNKIGTTSGGHDVFSHGMVGDYPREMGSKGHQEAANMHISMAQKLGGQGNFKEAAHHQQKGQLHLQRARTMETKPAAQPSKPQVPFSGPRPSKLYDPQMSGKVDYKSPKMGKALDAGSALAGPANLSGGAALGKEELDKSAATTTMMQKDAVNPKLAPKDVKVKQLRSQIDAGKYKPNAGKIADKMLSHPEKPLKKVSDKKVNPKDPVLSPSAPAQPASDEYAKRSQAFLNKPKASKSRWLMRAEEDYKKWEKREAFEVFMQNRMPHLTKSEIQVIGQTMLMHKAIEMEKSLKSLAKDFYDPSVLRGSEKK